MSPVTRVPKTQAALSLATRTLIERLRQLQPGETTTYAELSALAGEDIQFTHRGLLQRAMDYVWEELHTGLEVVINVGVQRLTEEQKIGHASRRRRYAHNYSTKTVRRLQTTDLGSLTPLQKHQWMVEASIAAAVSLATAEQTQRQLQEQATPQPVQIDPRQYVGLFQGL